MPAACATKIAAATPRGPTTSMGTNSNRPGSCMAPIPPTAAPAMAAESPCCARYGIM